MVLVTALLNGKILLHTLGLWNTPIFRYFPITLDLAVQPLLYLYIVAITAAPKNLKRLALLHLLPAILFMAHALLVYSQVMPLVNMADKVRVAAVFYYNQVKAVEDYLSVLSFLIYLYLSWQQLLLYRQWVNAAISDASYPTYTWLRNLLLFMSGVTTLLLTNIILDYGFYYGETSFVHWQIFYLLLTIVIYFMGFKGYQQTISSNPLPEVAKAVVEFKKDSPELISFQEVQRNSQTIRQLLEGGKIYRNPTLTIQELAKQVNLPANIVSYTISKAFQKSFRDLINEYRIEEVKSKLNDPAFQHLSILGMALDSGFNSEASFYRVFKKHTNVSPKEYQANNR